MSGVKRFKGLMFLVFVFLVFVQVGSVSAETYYLELNGQGNSSTASEIYGCLTGNISCSLSQNDLMNSLRTWEDTRSVGRYSGNYFTLVDNQINITSTSGSWDGVGKTYITSNYNHRIYFNFTLNNGTAYIGFWLYNNGGRVDYDASGNMSTTVIEGGAPVQTDTHLASVDFNYDRFDSDVRHSGYIDLTLEGAPDFDVIHFGILSNGGDVGGSPYIQFNTNENYLNMSAISFQSNDKIIIGEGTFNMVDLKGNLDLENFSLEGQGENTILQYGGSLTASKTFSINKIKFDNWRSHSIVIDIDETGESVNNSIIQNSFFTNSNGSLSIVSDDSGSTQNINNFSFINNTIENYTGSEICLVCLNSVPVSDITLDDNYINYVNASSQGASVFVLGTNSINTTGANYLRNNYFSTVNGGAVNEVHFILMYGLGFTVSGNNCTGLGGGTDHEPIYGKIWDSIIENNTLWNNSADDGAITVKGGEDSHNNTIRYNNITSNTGRGLFLHGSGKAYENHIESSSTGIVIYGYNSQLFNVSRNFILSQGDGLYLNAINDSLVNNNIIVGGSSEEGLRVLNSHRTKIYSNIIHGFNYTIYYDGGNSDLSFYNNILFNGGTFDVLNNAGILNWDYNNALNYEDDSSSYSNDINSTPLFINTSGNLNTSIAFYPLWNSNTLDVGTNVNLTTDYAGNPIYGTPDIGAYEYQPPYNISEDRLNLSISKNIRIYGDGKYRHINSGTSTENVNLSVEPIGGFNSSNYSSWMDLNITTWSSSVLNWSESSDILGDTNITHTLCGLTSGSQYDTYYTKSGTRTLLARYTVDSSGCLIFNYTQGYSTVVFDAQLYTAPAETTTATTSGSTGAPSYSIASSDLQQGYHKKLYRNSRLRFNVGNESHQLKLDSINKTSRTATITISSDPQTRTLAVGEEWKVDLDNDSSYDLLVRLDNVIGIRADVFVKEIDEAIVSVDDGVEDSVLDDVVEEIVLEKSFVWVYYLGGVVLLIVIIGLVCLKMFGKKKVSWGKRKRTKKK